MSRATHEQIASRPIVFDGHHMSPSAACRAGRGDTNSREQVVLDVHAGPTSATVTVMNTPETREVIRKWLKRAETTTHNALVITARDAKNAPRRLVLQTVTVKP